MMTANKSQYSVDELAASYLQCLEQNTPSQCKQEIEALCGRIEWPDNECDYSYPKLETGFDAFDIDFNLAFYQQL